MTAEHYPGFAADLDLVVAHTRHGRYRVLTDPAAPEYRPGYVEAVRARAAGLAGRTLPATPPAEPAETSGRADVLIVHRDFKRHQGLGVNAAHTAACLARLGVAARVVPAAGPAEAEAALAARPRAVVYQANAFPLIDMVRLARARPETRFVVRAHSNLAFLQAEPSAFDHFRGVLSAGLDNLTLAAVSSRLARECSDLWGPCRWLPNLYDLGPAPARAPSDEDGPLRVGVFGAPRLQKHAPVGLAAALLVAKRLGRAVEVHVNTKEETTGSPVPAMLRSMVDGLPWAALIEVPWGPPGPFRELVATMDLCFQLSSTETFNICSADAAACGVPSVVGEAIEWMDRSCVAPIDDAHAAAEVGLDLLADPEAGARCRAALCAHQRAAEGHWGRFLDIPTRKPRIPLGVPQGGG